jgi:hypothetical protein
VTQAKLQIPEGRNGATVKCLQFGALQAFVADVFTLGLEPGLMHITAYPGFGIPDARVVAIPELCFQAIQGNIDQRPIGTHPHLGLC